MKVKKLTKKEYNEVVTKGYLQETLQETLKETLKNYPTKDYLDKKLDNYVTKDYLDKKLDNFVTKDYLDYKLDTELKRYVGALTEEFTSQMKTGFEAMNIRFDRIEDIVNRHDKDIENHGHRISHLELRTKNL